MSSDTQHSTPEAKSIWPKWMIGLGSEWSPETLLQQAIQSLNGLPTATCIAGLTYSSLKVKLSVIPKKGPEAGMTFDLVTVHIPNRGCYPVSIEPLVFPNQEPQTARDDEEFLLRLRDHLAEAINELDL